MTSVRTPQPLHAVPVADLRGPLLLLRRGAGDHAVVVDTPGGREVVGRILQVARGAQRVAFLWSLTGPAAPGAGILLSNDADTLKQAMAAFRVAFDALLTWADAEHGGRLPWHRPAPRIAP